MGKLTVAVGLVACLMFFWQERYGLLGFAGICTVGTFWTYGIMHNYSIDAAAGRRSFRGTFREITPRDTEAVPNALALVNLVFSVASLGLLIAAILLAL